MHTYAKSFQFLSMRISILNIGDELLAGKTLNTNSQWIGEKVSSAGFQVETQITVKDEEDAIISCINYCLSNRPKYLIVTGGLGPTDDDVTRNVLFKYMDTKSVFDYDYWKILVQKYKRSGINITESVKNQAIVPITGEVISNPKGSARGLKFIKNDTVIFVLPGVPFEMKSMFSESILPQLVMQMKDPILSRTLRTTGVPESKLYDFITTWSKDDKNKIGYYPSIYGVDIKISNKRGKEIDLLVDWIYKNFKNYIYGEKDTNIETKIVKTCIKQGKELAIAESCTGGLIGDRITNVAGSSKIFKGGVIVYSNDSKANILDIDKKNIDKFGAVSKETAKKMAENVKTMFNTSFGLSVTGIAGPSGGSKEKPVGLVYIGLASNKKSIVEKFNFGKDREVNKIKTSQSALNILRKGLVNE